MAHKDDWVPRREQDFTDFCGKLTAGLADFAKITAYGWGVVA